MATLYHTTNQLRKVVVIAFLIIMLIIGMDTIIRVLDNLSRQTPVIDTSFYEKSNASLGEIPLPKIPSLPIVGDSNPTFAIEREFPLAPDTVRVYLINADRIPFTFDKVLATASTLGFSDEAERPGQYEYEWTNEIGSRRLAVDAYRKEWNLTTQYIYDPVAQASKDINTDISFYERKTSSIISSLGFRKEDADEDTLAAGDVKGTYATFGPDGLPSEPANPARAEYVFLDVFRQLTTSALKPRSQWTTEQLAVEDPPTDIFSYVYKQNPLQGSMQLVVSNEIKDLTRDIFSFKYTDYDYNLKHGIYRAVTPAEAWNRVQQGEGSLVLARLNTDDYFTTDRVLDVANFTADASRTELAYFEPDANEGYVYPIYVFRGRLITSGQQLGEFVFYVDALMR